jgi:hypothetical protein
MIAALKIKDDNRRLTIPVWAECGDRCLLYTDGILEAKNAAEEQFGKSRCNNLLETQRDIPAALFANTLLNSVARFAGPHAGRRHDPPRARFSKGAHVSRKLCRGQQISRSDLAVYKLVSRS